MNTLLERLHTYSRFDHNGCRLWMRSTDSKGYGQLKVDGRLVQAHRAMWMATHGPIPKGICVCHHCDVPLCLNPEHLFLGTQGENNADRHRKGRSRGPRGERASTAKINHSIAAEIRALKGVEFQRITAARFGLTQSHVSAIQRGAKWLE